MALQEELASTANKISLAKQAHNDTVPANNTARAVFPNNLVGGFSEFRVANLFEASAPAELGNVMVQF